MQDDKPNLVILNVMSKRVNSLRALVDSGASNNFVRQESLRSLDFEEADTPRGVLEVRLATGATVRTEKRVVRVRFSYKRRTFVEDLIVLDLYYRYYRYPWRYFKPPRVAPTTSRQLRELTKQIKFGEPKDVRQLRELTPLALRC
ncbi:hypothetical protein P3T76_011833 [Phytophthora citrophthora]|uniref:Uncharacterized protein n=1 Tax=Phytophthora citrophthora TaxID=4793 RepID=A0AAD9G805_9STRA|nr:hypothetical protein P3T76_011833 [Phytophthora citrophthora]